MTKPKDTSHENDWQDPELGVLSLAQATSNLSAEPIPQFPVDLNADECAVILHLAQGSTVRTAHAHTGIGSGRIQTLAKRHKDLIRALSHRRLDITAEYAQHIAFTGLSVMELGLEKMAQDLKRAIADPEQEYEITKMNRITNMITALSELSVTLRDHALRKKEQDLNAALARVAPGQVEPKEKPKTHTEAISEGLKLMKKLTS